VSIADVSGVTVDASIASSSKLDEEPCDNLRLASDGVLGLVKEVAI
jgi:hypothetical protein